MTLKDRDNVTIIAVFLRLPIIVYLCSVERESCKVRALLYSSILSKKKIKNALVCLNGSVKMTLLPEKEDLAYFVL